MDTTQFLLMFGIVFLILLAIGVFVATLTYWQRDQAKNRVRQAPQAIAPRPAPRPEPQTQKPDVPPPMQTPAHPGEVMRVIRDDETGRVAVEVNGQRYAHIRDIRDPQVGRRVLWAIADLIRFTGGMAANPQAVRSVSQEEPPTRTTPQPVRAPTPSAPSPPSYGNGRPIPASTRPGASPPRSTTFSQQPRLAPAQEEEPSTVGQSVRAFFSRPFSGPTVEPLPGPSIFVDEIEEILQGYIQGRPTPLPYEIHVKSGEDGTLQIEVGLDVYSSPDEVPDPKVRQLIKSAVAEWENR